MIANSRKGHRGIAVGLLVVAVAAIALGIYYLVAKTSFLASHYGTQPKRSIVCFVVAVIALFGANIAWRHKAS